jgi:RNA polymerase sigma-70 factor, ECF subfamily
MSAEPLANLSDAELVALAGRPGDDAERAFETLYFRHREFVFRVARRFAGDDQLAMDASQEVFAYLLRKLPRLRLSGKLGTYLYPIAKNLAISARRRDLRFKPAVEIHLDRFGEFPLEDPRAFEQDDRLRSVWMIVAELPEAQREVLLMRIVDGLSVDETAAALGVPAGTVKSRLFHAIAALRGREELRAYWEE